MVGQPAGAADGLPAAFQQDPVAFLSAVAGSPPSRQALDQLGGAVASWFTGKSSSSDSSNTTVTSAAAAYLQAAAMHLPETAASTGNPQLEMLSTQKQYEIVTVRH